MARRPSLHRRIVSRRTPLVVGTYAHAVYSSPGQLLHVGQLLPITPPKGGLLQGPARAQAELLLVHLRDVLAAAHMSLDMVVSMQLCLVDLQALAAWEAQLPKFFVGYSQPARTVLQVAALPGGASMSLSACAVQPADAAPLPPLAAGEDDAEALQQALEED